MRVWYALLGLAALAILLAPLADSQERFAARQIFPADDAEQDEELAMFLRRLRAAVDNKDVDYLVRQLAEDVHGGPGMDNTVEGFRQRWQLDIDPDNSPLWDELVRVLDLGGVMLEGVYVAPYVAARFPADLPMAGHGVITGRNVNVREGPSLQDPIVSQEHYAIVRMVDAPDEQPVVATINRVTAPWHKINLPSGQIGYVFGHYLRKPDDYRAGFRRIDGAWKLFFLAQG